MVALNAPVSGCCDVNALSFWHLRITKAFSKPGYHIGQTVLHRMTVPRGEILHPVEVIGLFWTGAFWQYAVSLPEEHPWFEVDDREVEWVDECQVEPM